MLICRNCGCKLIKQYHSETGGVYYLHNDRSHWCLKNRGKFSKSKFDYNTYANPLTLDDYLKEAIKIK